MCTYNAEHSESQYQINHGEGKIGKSNSTRGHAHSQLFNVVYIRNYMTLGYIDVKTSGQKVVEKGHFEKPFF